MKTTILRLVHFWRQVSKVKGIAPLTKPFLSGLFRPNVSVKKRTGQKLPFLLVWIVLVALVAGCQFDKLSVDKGRLEPWGSKLPSESSVPLP